MWHFLRLNGYDLDIGDDAVRADALTSLIERRSTEADLVALLQPHVVPLGIG
jgi:hypothetical protein